MLDTKGPLLIAANHPNSFLDAIILATLFKRPIHSLARGDAFANKFFVTLLHSLNIYPIYRESEGTKNLSQNYVTFDSCLRLFSRNEIVLIFCEGRCENEWHLRPLKKGTARLAMNAWSKNIPLKILPLGINYDSFKKFGKRVHLNFGELITEEDVIPQDSEGKTFQKFNSLLQSQLHDLVYEIPNGDPKLIQQMFGPPPTPVQRALLALPAFIGFVLNAPLYYLVHAIINKKAVGHYDSIMAGMLFLLYPFYLLVFAALILCSTLPALALLVLLIFPLSALALLHYRK